MGTTSLTCLLALALAASAAPLRAQELVYQAPQTLPVRWPIDLEVDATGNIYVACQLSDNAFKIEPDGTTTLLIDASGDGTAGLEEPTGLAVDSQGNVFVAGGRSDNVFKVAPDGTVTQLLEAFMPGLGSLEAPDGLAVDALDNIYVSSRQSDRVYRIDPTGVVSLLVGPSGLPGGSFLDEPLVFPGPGGQVIVVGFRSHTVLRVQPGGAATEVLSAPALWPLFASFDAAGNVYVLGDLDGDVWRIDPSDVATQLVVGGLIGPVFNSLTTAPDGTSYFSGRYSATGNTFNLLAEMSPSGALDPLPVNGLLAAAFPSLDSMGNVYYMQAPSLLGSPATIYRWSPGDVVVEVMTDSDPPDGTLGICFGLHVEDDDEVLVRGSQAVYRIRTDGSIETVLDSTGNGTVPVVDRLQDVAWHGTTGLFVSAGDTDLLVHVDPETGEGTPILDAGGDGTNPFHAPRDLAVDAAGNVIVAAEGSDNAFRVSPDGATVELLIDATGDGQGNPFEGGHGVTVDSVGNVYVSGALSDNVFKITPAGVITEVLDATGDGMGNTLNDPRGMAVDGFDNVYVAGRFSDNVFRISPTGVVTEMIDLDGDGLGNGLDAPTELTVSKTGTLYVSGSLSGDVFRVTPAGAVTQHVSAADTGSAPFLGPEGLAVDAFGSLYVTCGISDNVFRVDSGGQVSEVFNPSFSLLSRPLRAVVDDQERVYVIGNRTNNIWRLDGPPLWTDLGGAIEAPAGAPLLRMRGPLTPGSAQDRVLSNAPPSQPVLVWIALGPTTPIPFVPFLGGEVHTFPFNSQVFFFTDAFGDSVLSIPWPGGTPSGIDLTLQFLMEDFSVPGGIGLSNAVTTTTP